MQNAPGLKLFLYLFVYFLPAQELSYDQVRLWYEKAVSEQESAELMLERLQAVEEPDALLTGYQGAAHMFLARHVGNPFSKMSHFKKGKALLAEAIKADPTDAELRFLRFAVQAEAPGFLGYQDELHADKAYLLEHYAAEESKLIRERIYLFLLSSDVLSPEERRRLKQNK